MTDLKKALAHVESLSTSLSSERLRQLSDILGRNQNASCGGDGSFNETTWKLLQSVCFHLNEVDDALGSFADTVKGP